MESPNDNIFSRARFLGQRMDRNQLLGVTLIILYDLEVPLKGGFEYLKKAIPTVMDMPIPLGANDVYEAVAREMDEYTSVDAVEQAISKAIKGAWDNRKENRWENYFPEYILRAEEAPTNLTFLIAMRNFLEMWQSCCKEVEHAVSK